MSISNVEKINDHFKLPIFYNKNKIELKEEIVNDLELVKTIDLSCNPIYHYAFEPESVFAEQILQQMKKHYTNDTIFLQDSQKLLSTYRRRDEIESNYKNILEVWKEIKDDNGFKQKYYYMDWTFCEFLNNSDQFLQFMSLYNLAAPVLSFLIPIVILIIPFFIVFSILISSLSFLICSLTRGNSF